MDVRSDIEDLNKRLLDLELRSEKQDVRLDAQARAIKQLIAEHVTKEEQINVLFQLVLDDLNLEQLGGVN